MRKLFNSFNVPGFAIAIAVHTGQRQDMCMQTTLCRNVKLFFRNCISLLS